VPERRRTDALLTDALRGYRGTRPFLVSSFDPSVPVYLAGRSAAVQGVALGLVTSENLSADQCVAAAANLGLDAACVYTATLHLDRDDDGPVRGGAARVASRTIELAHQGSTRCASMTSRRYRPRWPRRACNPANAARA
jgi:hypothetical protein